jgi:hypothetical protein
MGANQNSLRELDQYPEITNRCWKNTCETDNKNRTKNQLMSSQAFHRTTCRHVQKTTAREQFRLGKLKPLIWWLRTRPVTLIDQPITQLGLRAKKPWTKVNPPEDTKNGCSTGNLGTREIGPADSVGRIEPHADKNETDKICGDGNPSYWRTKI